MFFSSSFLNHSECHTEEPRFCDWNHLLTVGGRLPGHQRLAVRRRSRSSRHNRRYGEVRGPVALRRGHQQSRGGTVFGHCSQQHHNTQSQITESPQPPTINTACPMQTLPTLRLTERAAEQPRLCRKGEGCGSRAGPKGGVASFSVCGPVSVSRD